MYLTKDSNPELFDDLKNGRVSGFLVGYNYQVGKDVPGSFAGSILTYGGKYYTARWEEWTGSYIGSNTINEFDDAGNQTLADRQFIFGIMRATVNSSYNQLSFSVVNSIVLKWSAPVVNNNNSLHLVDVYSCQMDGSYLAKNGIKYIYYLKSLK